jgi:ribonuclease-3
MNKSDGEFLSHDDIKLRILNEKNIYITKKFINSIFKKVNFEHKVQNLENFQKAMIHSTYLITNLDNPKSQKILKDTEPIDEDMVTKCIPLQTNSYERLEYLGDSILRHAIGKYLFNRFPNEDEGFLTTIRSKIERKSALSELCKKLGLQKYAIISRSIESVNGRMTNITLTEDILEAFIGALNLEVSDDQSRDFICKLIEKEVDFAEIIRTKNNYKDMIMQYFHKCYEIRHDLEYVDEELESTDGRRKFKSYVKDKNTNEILGCGKGKSKKSSQQRAAKSALLQIGIIGNDKEEDEYFDIKK